jgi:hypothetical protein
VAHRVDYLRVDTSTGAKKPSFAVIIQRRGECVPVRPLGRGGNQSDAAAANEVNAFSGLSKQKLDFQLKKVTPFYGFVPSDSFAFAYRYTTGGNMASKTVKQYRVLVDELDSLLRDWQKGAISGSESAHIKAIQAVADHIRSSVCARLTSVERQAADVLVSRADATIVRFFANTNVEYCFVIDHPTLGQIGGFDEDNWDIDRDVVEKSAAFVRKDWPTRIISRNVTTTKRIGVSNGE